MFWAALFLAGLLVTPARAETVTYLHTDLLGSVVLETDQNRNVVARYEYEPYGLPRQAIADAPGYTGHVHDAGSGLVYMQQRYYDPEVGRFLSVDPMPSDTATGWNFNRYNYAANNPYTFVDPDGRMVGEPWKEHPGQRNPWVGHGPPPDRLTGPCRKDNPCFDGGGQAEQSPSDSADHQQQFDPDNGKAESVLGPFEYVAFAYFSLRSSIIIFRPGPDDVARSVASLPTQSGQLKRIFRNAPGHLSDTPANRNLLIDVASNPANRVGVDRFGNVWSTLTRADGTQVWVSTRNGVIQNGGLNRVPQSFPTITGP